MEAMNIMGMAASQARFLGLTARKSNVEYQGQQINQQRTALANESANLYNQMMALEVPVPPKNSEFYQVTYTLDNSADAGTSDYTLGNITKVYGTNNKYKVTLMTKVEQQSSTKDTVSINNVVKDKEKEEAYSISLSNKTNGAIIGFTYDKNDLDVKTNSEGTKKVEPKHIYRAYPDLDGYNQCCTSGNDWYFYRDNAGENHFMTMSQLTAIIQNSDNSGFTTDILKAYTYYKDYSTEVEGVLETSSSGRYSSIIVDDTQDENGNKVYGKFSGITYNISTTQETDKAGYDDAYNDYEYNKAIYEKTIQDINSQTEIIQKEDQQLELRLQQLNTEQQAISTEMDSVSKVIDDNVDKTFKVFA